MIREYKLDDKENIINILNEGLILDMSYINDDFLDENSKVMVYEEDEIKGFVLLSLRNISTKFWNIDIYVKPDSRKRGIGKKLYNEAIKYIKDRKVNTISTNYVEAEKESNIFYKKIGFKGWFSFYEMVYEGDINTNSNLEFINYEDRYYKEYVQLIADSFYDLREANDIQPYVCYKPSKEDRKNVLKNKDNIYLSIDDTGTIISTVMIEDGHIDELVVNKKYENRGFGNETTKFAINKAIEGKSKKITLDVIVWNVKATNIYKKLGFKVIQKINVERQFIDKKI